MALVLLHVVHDHDLPQRMWLLVFAIVLSPLMLLTTISHATSSGICLFAWHCAHVHDVNRALFWKNIEPYFMMGIGIHSLPRICSIHALE